jgi:hypothetical protein
MSRKRDREEDNLLVNVDVSKIPRDVWELVTRFLSLADIKNLSQVNRQLANRVRIIMLGKFRFVVPGSLSDFKALGWTKACQNIRLTCSNSVFELKEDDVYVDITLPSEFNQFLEEVTWPSRLTHLTFDERFNQPVDRLPASLTHLTFGIYFNQPVDRLPASLTHLSFGWCFNQPVDCLPASLTHLTFGYHFNQLVDRLPVSLTHLTFGGDFNQPVDHLPAFLTHLTFGGDFNQPVDRLPASLTHLTLRYSFDQPVDRLPASLTHLGFGWAFNQPVNLLPGSLKEIIVKMVSQVELFPPAYHHLVIFKKSNI